LGVVAGTIGAITTQIEMELYLLGSISSRLEVLFGYFIPLLSIAIPQYIYKRRVSEAKYSHLILTGSIAIIVMVCAMVAIDYISGSGRSLEPEIFPKIIGLGTAVSIVTALLVNLVKTKNIASSEPLDDIDY